MTNEDAIKIAKGLRYDFKCESETMVDFCNIVIEALEQNASIFDEIKKLAEFHSETVTTATRTEDGYIDWEEKRVIPLSKLDTILNEIKDTDCERLEIESEER